MNIEQTLEDMQPYEGSIKEIVIQDALDSEDPLNYLRDVTTHGCVSGMVSGLIYYTDTHKFYDEHYDEIEELRQEYKDEIGEEIQVKNDLKNFYSWFAYEWVASKLLSQLED